MDDDGVISYTLSAEEFLYDAVLPDEPIDFVIMDSSYSYSLTSRQFDYVNGSFVANEYSLLDG